MIKLTVCFIIVNLAFANALYGFTKQYEYPHSDLIISDEPYGFNKLAYAVCKGNDHHVRKCKIYQELIQDESNDAVWSCNLKLNSTSHVNIQNANPTHVIVTVKDDRKVTLITLNMGMCSVKETTIEADVDRTVQIVPKGDRFDVIFKNDELCGKFYCIATYDLNGVIIKGAGSFSFETSSTILVSKADKGYLVAEAKPNFLLGGYYVTDGDFKHVALSGAPFYNTQLYSASTAENKLGFCIPFETKQGVQVACQKFQAEGTSVITQVLSPPSRRTNWESTSVLNLEKGLFVLMREAGKWGHGQMPATVYVYDEEGNIAQTFEDIDLSCKEGYSSPKVFENLAGDACITSICRDLSLQNKFSRTYKCVPKYQLE